MIVATFHSAEEAELLKAQLESAGIEADVPEEFTTGVFSAVIPFQTVTVQVHAKDYEAARAIVAAFAPASAPTSQPPDEGSPPESAAESGEEPALAQPPVSKEAPGMTRCVSCGALIPLDSILCPKCGWTQPRLA